MRKNKNKKKRMQKQMEWVADVRKIQSGAKREIQGACSHSA